MKKLKDVPFEKIYVGMPVVRKFVYESPNVKGFSQYKFTIDEVGAVNMKTSDGIQIKWHRKEDCSLTGNILYSYLDKTTDLFGINQIYLDPERM